MAAEMLIINPSRRKGRRKATSSKRRTRRAAASTSLAPRRRRRYAHNPIRSAVMRRRRNPIGGRRRRNPISLGSQKEWFGMLRDAAIGGAGAIAVDLLMGQLNKYLPDSLKTSETVGVGDAVKAAVTVLAGVMLSKSTKGLSRKMAQGALTVQAADLMRAYVPTEMPLGYASPAKLVNRSARLNPARSMSRFTSPGTRTPLLSQFTTGSPLVSGTQAQREMTMR